MIVAIHQPNYLPWAGYFHKLAKADSFVILDDVQFTKNSYINRSRILEGGRAAWLTVPAKPPLGTPINRVQVSQPDWPGRHMSRIANAYGRAPYFKPLRDELAEALSGLSGRSLADANRALITLVCRWLEIDTPCVLASDIANPDALRSDERLISILMTLGASTYLSGRGGASYQDPQRFAAAGITLTYSRFAPAPYHQTDADGFQPGLSILDVLAHLGPRDAADYIRREADAA